MKIFKFFLLILFLQPIVFSQQFYFEQNSGTTKSLRSVCMSPDYFNIYRVWVCGDSGTVLVTTNLGTNWLNSSNAVIPVNVNLNNINTYALDTAIVSGKSNSATYSYRTVNGGLNWSQVFTQTNGSVNGVWMKDAMNGFMCGDPVGGRWSLWKTVNGGATWDSAGLYLPQAGSEKGWTNSLQVLRNNIWFGTNNSRIYYSSNYGSSWSVISTTPEINSTSLWFYSLDTSKGCFGGTNFYGTTNLGSNWTSHTCPGSGNLKGYCFGPVGVYDDPWGQCFVLREGGSGIYMSYQVFSNFQTDYTTSSGTYNHLAYNNFVYPLSPGMYSWAVKNNGGITKFSTFRGGAVNLISSEIPERFSLTQNYPNPFNPVTHFGFRIADFGSVKLAIFDALGREVQILVDQELHPGSYEVDWDASAFPSGVYYYKLDVNSSNISERRYIETKKMVLIK